MGILKGTFFTKKFKIVPMGILKVTFCTKIEKTKKCETLTHGDFDNIFEKKWKMNIFR